MASNGQHSFLTRIILFALSILGLYFFVFHENSVPFSFLMIGICIYQVKLLADQLRASDKSIDELFGSMSFDDLTYSFKTKKSDPETARLKEELNNVLTKLKNSRRERDSEFLFFRNIVMHIGIGLIVYREDGGIEIFNSAARRLLKMDKAENIKELEQISPLLVTAFQKLKTGGRELLSLKIKDELIPLSIYAIELTLRSENVKLISLQNIQSELEEKEMEAWQNLVKVLTHEIMNSVTPISSLARVIEEELKPYLSKETISMKGEELQDIHLSLQTIGKRSEGLIHFVKEFRSLTNIPKPRPTVISVRTLLEEVSTLHRMEMADKNIALDLTVYPEDLTILADKAMIEQVLINLIKNAIQSFDEDQNERSIALKAYISEKSRPVISVKDNGAGIDPEALDKIFIPFFTTKKSGSGIGLSLSRQILRQHQGTLTVKSEVGVGTEFFLKF